MKLTALTIENLPHSDKQQIIYDEQLPGFGVRVGKKAKTFVLTVGRERKIHTLGRYPAISLKNARQSALRLLAEQDSAKHVKPRIRANEAIEAFMVEKQAQSRDETLKTYNRSLKTHLKGIHQKYIEDVTTDDITSVTDKLLKAGKGASANQVLVQAKGFFHWCVKRRLISHSPVEGLDKPARQLNRERVLSDEELKAIYKATIEPTAFNNVIRLCMITGQRRGELSKIVSGWIEGDIISFPPEVVKNKRRHVLPIGELTKEYLKRAPFYISSWSDAKTELDKVSGVADWKIHDLRRSYAVSLQRLGVELETIEKLLNHVSGRMSGIVGVYQKWDRWPKLVEAVELHEAWFTKEIVPV